MELEFPIEAKHCILEMLAEDSLFPGSSPTEEQKEMLLFAIRDICHEMVPPDLRQRLNAARSEKSMQ